MRLLTVQWAVFRPLCADEPSESPEGRLEARYSRLVGKQEVIERCRRKATFNSKRATEDRTLWAELWVEWY